jgi:hypothetical protein
MNGYSAMFVETEIIVRNENYLSSYVQCRGSVPWIWNQNADFVFNPTLNIRKLDTSTNIDPFLRHIDLLKAKYSCPITILNLLNNYGNEQVLSKGFSKLMELVYERDRDLEYFNCPFNQKKIYGSAFDRNFFRRSNGGTIFQELSRMFHSRSHGNFLMKVSHNSPMVIISKQKGIIRSNCLDCVDRTGKVQYLFVLASIYFLLKDIGVSVPLGNEEEINDFYLSELEIILGKQTMETFKKNYAEANKAISQQCNLQYNSRYRN